MNIVQEKIIIKTQIDEINDEECLLMLKSLISFINRKKYATPLTLKEYNLKLAESEEAYQTGKTLKHEELLTEVENWKQSLKK